MKLLITGGAGFIGTNFIHHILLTYPTYEVINLDLLTYAGDKSSLAVWENDSRYSFVQGDICNRELVDSLVSKVDAIIHFAAESHVDRSISDASPFITTNIMGTYILLESARIHGNKRFHHISTDEVFGSLSETELPFNEHSNYDPRSPYSASKASSDHLAMSYFHTYGLPVTISNCSNNYGPFQFPEKLIPLAVTNILEKKSIPIYGDGKQVRDWLYVGDHCIAIDTILHKGVFGEVYCVGGNSEKRNIDTIKKIIDTMGETDDILEYVTDRMGHDRRYAISYTKLESSLGWFPKVSFEDGIKLTVEWYKNNEAWWKRKKLV